MSGPYSTLVKTVDPELLFYGSECAGPKYSLDEQPERLFDPAKATDLPESWHYTQSKHSPYSSTPSSITCDQEDPANDIANTPSEHISRRSTSNTDSSASEELQAVENQEIPSEQGSKLFCNFKGCKNKKSYSHEKELKRHLRTHDPQAQWWFCGCCANLGKSSSGWYRKDKCRDHLRKNHPTSAPTDSYNQECPEAACATLLLFATESCVTEHIRQKHPQSFGIALESETDVMENRPSGAEGLESHYCGRTIATREYRQIEQSQSTEHVLLPPTPPVAKRRKLENNNSYHAQSVERLPLYAYTAPMFSNWEISPKLMNGATYLAMNGHDQLPGPFVGDSGLFLDQYHNLPISDSYIDENSMSSFGQLSMPEIIDTGATADPYVDKNLEASYNRSLSFKRDMNDIHPADFLEIHGTEEFRFIKSTIFNTSYQSPQTYTLSITYIARRRTIVLKGNAANIDAAESALQQLFQKIYTRKGGPGSLNHYVADRYPPQGSISNVRTAKHSTEEDSTRIFALSPKTNRKTIQLWMKSFLPAIDNILSERLGPVHSASLVRCGQTDIHAVPCILIESPNTPGYDTMESIQDAINDICDENFHPKITIRFLQGTFQKLLGGRDDSPTLKTAEEPGHLKFNFNRPCKRPGMGSSLGLLCSKKVSATLGGYIQIEGGTYVLTSDHFVAKAQEVDNPNDDEQIISPSGPDLLEMVGSLKQIHRDVRNKVDLTMSKLFDRPITLSELDHSQDPRVEELLNGLNDIQKRLEQVDKPFRDFALGRVFRRTTEVPRSVLTTLSLSSEPTILKHRMDWAVCSVNNRVGENRPKYKSNQDAIDDDYIYEEDRFANPGELCFETCDIEPGAKVYYVGQRSGFRNGVVSPTPINTRIGAEDSQEWAIVGEEGAIALTSVEGDSGAWVIRRHDNKLMGQVVAHATGQILFTPVNVIFADIKEDLNLAEDVSLPHSNDHRHLGPAVTTNVAIQLCAVEQAPRAYTYKWLEPKVLKDDNLLRLLNTDGNTRPGTDARRTHIQGTGDGSDEESVGNLSSPKRAPLSPVPSLIADADTPPPTPHLGSSTPRNDLLWDNAEPPEYKGKDLKAREPRTESAVIIVGELDRLGQSTVEEHGRAGDSISSLPFLPPKESPRHKMPRSIRFTITPSMFAQLPLWPTVRSRSTQTLRGRQGMPINTRQSARWESGT